MSGIAAALHLGIVVALILEVAAAALIVYLITNRSRLRDGRR
jgi:hypothetical protein